MKVKISKHTLKATFACGRKGWLLARNAQSLTLQQLAIFEEGNVFEAAVTSEYQRVMQAPVNLVDAIGFTKHALSSQDHVLIQPAFEVDGVVLRPDAIDTASRKINEIKSGKNLKDSYILDVALSRAFARENGYEFDAAVIHINPNFRLESDEQLTREVDVTSLCDTLDDSIDIRKLIETINADDSPSPSLSKECKGCEFAAECFTSPEHLILTIPRLRPEMLQKMLELGIEELEEVTQFPEIFEQLTNTQQSHVLDRSSFSTNDSNDDIDELYFDFISAANGFHWLFDEELFHLDFETVSKAIPLRTQEAPWNQSVTQFSVSKVTDDDIKEVGFLSNGQDDREEMIQCLIRALRGDAKIVVYSAGFEKSRLRELAKMFPKYRTAIDDILNRIVDLMDVVKHTVGGTNSQSLKVIAPAFVDGFTWDDLAISNGGDANAAMSLLLSETGKSILRGKLGLTESEVREALLEYCARDTLATAQTVIAMRLWIVRELMKGGNEK